VSGHDRPVRVGVVTFPGSLDDGDALRAVATMGAEPVAIWHGDHDLQGVDAVILPGGFSYGDHLRAGAIARFANVMEPIRRFAGAGGPVLGICNGFQVLCEAGLLPGALIRNRSLSFVCRWVNLRSENPSGSFTNWPDGEVIQIPIKHGEGQFVADEATLDRLERCGQIALRYCSPAGAIDEAFNPNGAARNIAGIRNERGNVIGLMPHPEHAVDPDLGPTGGQAILGWLLAAARERPRMHAATSHA
jgi:phosphoribosylformylglycinamidine synthase subunit PurQ / glutaminase